MDTLKTMTYAVDGRVARITLNRPERGNGITLDLPVELAQCVERADLDPAVHVIALSGNGKGFCGGYDLVASAERMSTDTEAAGTEVLLAGDGVDRYREVFAAVDHAELAGPEFSAPSALALLELAAGRLEREEFVTPAELTPVYLRESDAAINWERAQLRPAS